MMGGVFKQNQLREVDEIALAIAESERFRHAIEQGIDAGFQFESVQEQAPKRLAGSFEREATHLRDGAVAAYNALNERMATSRLS